MEEDITIIKEEICADMPGVGCLEVPPLSDPLELPDVFTVFPEPPFKRQAYSVGMSSEAKSQHLNTICLSMRIAIIRCFYSSSSCPTTALQMLKEEDNEIRITVDVEDINFLVKMFEKTGSVIDNHMDSLNLESEHMKNTKKFAIGGDPYDVESIVDSPIENNVEAVYEGDEGIHSPITVCLPSNDASENMEQLHQKRAKNISKKHLYKKNQNRIKSQEIQKSQVHTKKRHAKKNASPKQGVKKVETIGKPQQFPLLEKNQCRICKKKYPDWPSFHFHFLNHFNMTFLPKDGPYKCPACPKNYSKKQGFYTHLFRKCLLEKYDFSQNIQNSDKSIDSFDTLNPPSNEIPKEDDCFSSLIDKEEPQTIGNMSLSKNSKEKIYKCPRCPEILPNVRSLNYHFTKHFNLTHLNGDPPYNCPACDQLFHTKQTLYKHLRASCHKGKRRPETPFRCSTCSRAFQFEIQYEHHLLVHSGKAKLKECHYCGKKFKTTSGFRNHLISNHREKKAFQCDQCPKFFINSRHLEEHILSHSGTYLYTCDKCGKQYDTVGSYQNHLHSHINKSKRWQCEICGKDFSGSYDYARHKLIHTGEVKAVCDLCGKGFNRKDNLKVHVKSCRKRHQ